MEVKLIGLTKVFSKKEGDVVAVDHIDITVPSGKLVGLLGPSGCGKSTTLYMIAGLHRPTEGQIYFGEDEVSLYPPEKRGIGLVFQNYALYPHLTVQQNIMFPLENLKMPKEEALKKAQDMANLVGIGELMNRKPAQLSGGQQQRVAIARALVKMPRVLLLDEPLSNLDARLRLQTREEIKRIQQETGITTIFVTHDQEEAMSISDEIVVMNYGVVQQIGIPQEVYNNPINMFVAKFLGNPPINLIPSRIINNKINFYDLQFTDKLVTKEVLQKAAAAQVESKEEPHLFIGLRPEFIKVDSNGKYEVTVDIVEYIGRDKTIIFKFPGQENSCKAIVPSELDVNAGDVVKLSFSKYFLFGENGERLV